MLYTVLVAIARVVIFVFFRVYAQGRENVPEGGCLVVSNHLSWTDTAFILYGMPPGTRLYTLANESTVFNTGWKRWLMPQLCVVPIRRNRGMLDEDAVNAVYDLLDRGEKVLIFPEGAYGKDGQLRPLKDGVGYFAINSQKPILPVSLAGTGRLRLFRRIEVVIGRPFIPDPPMMWDIKRRVGSVVSGVRVSLGRLGRRSSRRRGLVSRLLRRRSARRHAAQPVEVEAGQPKVEGADAKAEEHQAQQQQP
ncbi:MAG: 1-acyl-sn-glycerol-3-phosphate acyltransferase [Chloroflexota bacterium]|jgi:1-acyl-sn-glycerol-3-phosphate acyltransferase|nr:1-acyl-sn-glycerol-3-phosphate acyltransferase [Chloroflexota bacterium]